MFAPGGLVPPGVCFAARMTGNCGLPCPVRNVRMRLRIQLLRPLLTSALAGTAMMHAPIATAQEAAGAGAIPMVGANLNISPRRVVFSGAGRADTVIVFNTGTEAATYNVELSDRAMTATGEIKPLAELTEADKAGLNPAHLQSAGELITHTPRRVVLAAGESQVIRLRRRPAPLAPGEYRSHLTVTAVPPREAGLTAESAAAEGLSKAEVSVSLTALFSVSIPVIVREGAVDVSATITGVQLRPNLGDGVAGIAFDLGRTGNGSLYGDVQVLGHKGEALAELKGIGVYTELSSRHVTLALKRPPRRGEEVRVTFTGQDLRKGEVLASASTTAP